ncbi:unnamed protein product [Adineta ricciae]|uniref:Uncharacterized protein n=1 Tax=Adineta ricciae TaxID=249248 RepID=A0A813NUP8_ADIRI|nr:unnamed protein product [Adineta ricciae]CAF1364546.1 unnamed protein product [Adineta ricciae]
MDSFNPLIGVRITTIGLVVGVICSVTVAAIAIPIILKNAEDPQKVAKATLRVALDRLIFYYELDRFYDKQATLHDLVQSLNEHFRQSNLSASFVNFIILKFTHRPFLIDPFENETIQDRPSIVAVEGVIYFTQNHTGVEILAAVDDYSRYVTLITRDGKPSRRLGTFSRLYSFATDTTGDELPEFRAKKLTSIEVDPDSDSMMPKDTVLFPDKIREPSDNGTDIAPEKPIRNNTILPYPLDNNNTQTATPSPIPNITATPYPLDNNNTQTVTPSPISNITATPYPLDNNNTQTVAPSLIPNITATPYPLDNNNTQTVTPNPILNRTIAFNVSDNTTGTNTPTMPTSNGDGNSSCAPLFTMNITIAVGRPMAENEVSAYYDRFSERMYFFWNLYGYMQNHFWGTFFSFAMSNMSDEPIVILNGSNAQEKRMDTTESTPVLPPLKQTVVIAISGRLYLKQSVTINEVKAAFRNYTPYIPLRSADGIVNYNVSVFMEEYSSFQDNLSTNDSLGNNSYSVCLNISCYNSIMYSLPREHQDLLTTFPKEPSIYRNIFKSDFHLSISINDENYISAQSYNQSAVADSIYYNLIYFFPNTMIDVVVSTMWDGIESNRRRRKRDSLHPTSLFINGTVFFLLDYTSDEVRNAFQDLTFRLVVQSNNANTTVSTSNITLSKSTFSDAYLAQVVYVDNSMTNCVQIH